MQDTRDLMAGMPSLGSSPTNSKTQIAEAATSALPTTVTSEQVYGVVVGGSVGGLIGGLFVRFPSHHLLSDSAIVGFFFQRDQNTH
jgi:hypothetical protein